jgi:hypothetical protein
LEQYHVALALSLMRMPQFNILDSLTTEQAREVREIVIELVLSTDLAKHKRFLAELMPRYVQSLFFSCFRVNACFSFSLRSKPTV